MKIHCLSMMSQNNHLNKRDRVNKLTKLSPWIMLSLHFQPKFEIKLTTHFLTRGKMRILSKYVENIRLRDNYKK